MSLTWLAVVPDAEPRYTMLFSVGIPSSVFCFPTFDEHLSVDAYCGSQILRSESSRTVLESCPEYSFEPLVRSNVYVQSLSSLLEEVSCTSPLFHQLSW